MFRDRDRVASENEPLFKLGTLFSKAEEKAGPGSNIVLAGANAAGVQEQKH